MTKVDIISGFLGAGKTTLIKKLLQEVFPGEKVVLIENEFGEIGIDGGFLKDAGIEIREMNSGCICCSLVGDFGESLKEVIETYHPARILIEPSGVGKLSDVIKAVQDVSDDADVLLNSYTVVVDVKKCNMYMRNFGEFYANQIEYAGAVILSRTDSASNEQVEQCIQMLRGMNEKAVIITTPIARLEGMKLLAAMERTEDLKEDLLKETNRRDCGCHDHVGHNHEEGCGCHEHKWHNHEEGCDCHEYVGHNHEEGCGCHRHEEHNHEEGCDCHGHEESNHDEDCNCHGHEEHHHAEEVFTSWGKETVTVYSREKIAEILQALESEADYGMVLRAKGMVGGEDGNWIYFDMVPHEHEIRDGSPEYTGRICVIGTKLKEEKLDALFA